MRKMSVLYGFIYAQSCADSILLEYRSHRDGMTSEVVGGIHPPAALALKLEYAHSALAAGYRQRLGRDDLTAFSAALSDALGMNLEPLAAQCREGDGPRLQTANLIVYILRAVTPVYL